MYSLYWLNASKNKWVNILKKSNNITWSSAIDTLSVELDFDSLYSMDEGNHVCLKEGKTIVFMGIITKRSRQKYQNSYTCNDYGWYLNKNEGFFQFKNIAASTCIEQICSNFGIKHSIEFMKPIIKKIYKSEALNDIISDIIKQAEDELSGDYCMEMDGEILKVRTLSNLKIYPKLIIADDAQLDSNLEDLKNEIIAVSTYKSKVKKTYITKKTKEKKTKKITISTTRISDIIKDSDSIAKYGKLQKVVVISKKDQSKTDTIAENKLNRLNKVKKELTFTALSVEKGYEVKANRLIYVNVIGVKGWRRINSCSHTLADGKHTISITLDWSVRG